MLTSEYIFKLIKKERNSLGNIQDYKIKISDSNNFKRENLIGVYKIRQYTAIREGNNKLSQQMGALISSLENYSKEQLRFVSLLGQKYYGIFYLNEDCDKVIGYLESKVDEIGNIINE
ncbi:enoyl-CoA hydratase [Chryseobacterium paridis]|uniref:Enoyl-CoA hydratase n=1 Tax=Chryseobacterium paridis TaxID=2800328 RepID=A0ABS1FYH2_9FLAO|nr:enoyl-CoA hydratase [Chryseobacterium paridis]MBK1897505.1 enoyl-CoA hydratase [Chryseobacterium paridis]